MISAISTLGNNNFLGLIDKGKMVMGKKVDQLLREEDDLYNISEIVDFYLKENKIEFIIYCFWFGKIKDRFKDLL